VGQDEERQQTHQFATAKRRRCHQPLLFIPQRLDHGRVATITAVPEGCDQGWTRPRKPGTTSQPEQQDQTLYL